jgi:hypothetical protein
MKVKAFAFDSDVSEKEVTISTFEKVRVGNFGVYQNKIWRAISSEGVGKDYKITLEREFSKEKITLHGYTEELKSLKKIISGAYTKI